jgi:hypothetical protein
MTIRLPSMASIQFAVSFKLITDCLPFLLSSWCMSTFVDDVNDSGGQTNTFHAQDCCILLAVDA